MSDTIQMISLGDLHESPFNPRRIFDDAALAELAESIQHEGILQPLLVRPRVPLLFARHQALEPDPDAITGYEVVFGHRRFRAAQLAGLQVARCIVRTMTDEDAKRAQIAENLQRQDVHPIEEAEGFMALIGDHGVTADELVEQVGKSRSYVYGRLKLLSACDQVRQACLSGDIGSETALLFSRQAPALQVKALEKLKGTQFYRARNGYEDGGKEGYRAIRDFLNEYFMLDLKEALWPLEAVDLVPDAGACTTCPKRTGCSPEIFADVIDAGRSGYRSKGGADVCTDPDCFADKKKAHLKLEAAKLEEKGKTVVAGNKARAAIDAQGKLKSGFIPIAEVRETLKKAKDTTVTTLHIQDPRTGKVVQAVREDDLVAAGLRKAKPKTEAGKSGSSSSRDWEQERKEREAQALAETNFRKALHAKIRPLMLAAPRSTDDMRLIARYAIDMMDYEGEADLAKLYGFKSKSDLPKAIDGMNGEQLAILLLDIVLQHGLETSGYDVDADREHLDAAAKLYGVDVDQVRAELTGEAVAKPVAKKAAKKKAKPAAADDAGQADAFDDVPLEA